MCDTLFHTRLEWDDHKLSADHLRKVGEQRRKFNPDLKDDEFELLDVIIIEDEDELPVASEASMLDDQEIREDKEDIEENEETEEEQAVVKDVDDTKEDENDMETNIASTEDDKEKETTEDKTEEETDTVKEDTSQAAVVVKKEKDEKYNPANVVGRELVVKTGGFVCRLCSVFMKNEEETELHCQTATHYINFTSIIKLHVSLKFYHLIS